MLIGIVGVGFAIGPSVLKAKNELEKAIPFAAVAQKAATTGDSATATEAAEQMRAHTASARSATQGRVWSVMENVPWVGANLSAIRVAAEEADRLTADVVIPMAGVGVASVKPVDGRIDVDAIRSLALTVSAVRESADASATRLKSVDHTLLLPPVISGLGRLEKQIGTLRPTLASVDDGLKVLPAVLGGDGPRNYLLLFQNNGEVMPGGGTIGSLAEVHVENGALAITRQTSASARDFPAFAEPVIALPAGSHETYPFGLGTQVQSLTRTPRFSLTSAIATEMWKRVYGVDIDGVIAIDTVALSYIMAATGPIDLPDGSKLTSENAVPMLLGDLYQDFTPAEVDVINQSVGSVAFSRIASGEVDIASLTKEITRASDERRILVWSKSAAEAALLNGSTFEQEPPVSTRKADAFGVYFVDFTPGKMQRFLQQSVDLSQAVCEVDGKRHVRVAVSLTNTVDPGAVAGLPEYVTGNGRATRIGDMRLAPVVYAPSGATMVGITRNGETIDSTITSDGDYPVNQAITNIAPGETVVMSFDVIAQDEVLRKLKADVTPIVSPTTVTQSVFDCSGVTAG